MRRLCEAPNVAVDRMIGVCIAPRSCHHDGIDVLPVASFLDELHAGRIFCCRGSGARATARSIGYSHPDRQTPGSTQYWSSRHPIADGSSGGPHARSAQAMRQQSRSTSEPASSTPRSSPQHDGGTPPQISSGQPNRPASAGT